MPPARCTSSASVSRYRLARPSSSLIREYLAKVREIRDSARKSQNVIHTFMPRHAVEPPSSKDRWVNYSTSPPWLADFVIASSLDRAARKSEFYRAERAGRFVRLSEGVHLPTTTWNSLSVDDQFRARVHAVARSSRAGLVFSHLSAAALWHLPLVGSWPSRPEVVVGSGAMGQSRYSFTARHFPLPSSPETIDDLLVTPLARTLVDVGRSAQLVTSVAMMDHALGTKSPHDQSVLSAKVSPGELAAEWGRIMSSRGRTRCGLAIQLADGKSGSPGETVSRVGMHLAQLPPPVLQQPFYDSRGLIGIADFWWPDFDLIGEFDGFGKYLRMEMLNGGSTADAVMSEKVREDRLRACGPRVTRWGWSVANSLPRLTDHLRAAGLR